VFQIAYCSAKAGIAWRGKVIVYDLREEARLISLIHLIAPLALCLGAVWFAPRSVQAWLPDALVDSARPLTFVFGLAAGVLGWMEYDERSQADALVERCLLGGCLMKEGPVYDVERVRQISSGTRYLAPMRGGYFKVGDTLYAHYPREQSNYSPANLLREGEPVRVYSLDGVIVLVEVEG
jgi:hypothetical protein